MTQASALAPDLETGLSPVEESRVRFEPAVLEARKLSGPKRKTGAPFESISLYVAPGELIAIAGPDGSGKTSLLTVLAGILPASDGKLQIDGVSLYENRKALRPRIGLVPHQGTVYPELTVLETLTDGTRLRLPRSVKAQERRERVDEVVALMDLQEQANTRVGALSPAQRWRAQVALELIGHPSLLLVDEPDEFVDAGGELSLVERLRGLTRQGLTVLMVMRAAGAVAKADKVLLLAPGGHAAWFGPPAEAVAYFAGSANAQDSSQGFAFDDSLALLANPEIATPKDWAERYTDQPAYKKYVDGPLKNKQPDLLLEDRPLTRLRAKSSGGQVPAVQQSSTLGQFLILLGRSFRLFFRDRTALLLAFGLPLVLTAVVWLLVSPRMYDPVAGDAAQVVAATALLAFLAILVAALSCVRAIVHDAGVYRRERQMNLKLIPYVLSKLALIIPIALFQGLVWAGAFFLAARVPAGPPALPNFAITLVLASLVGCLIGLVASALATSVQTGIAWVLLLTLPQLVLSGGLVPQERLGPVGKAVSAAMPSRYTFEALATASGYARGLAQDACWSLPENQRQSLTDQQKRACTCMGTNIFSRCGFPGVSQFATAASNQPPPVQPTPDSGVSNLPIQPALRGDEDLEEYARDVNSYTLQIEIYQGSVSNYMNRLRQYLVDLGNWQRQTGLAVGGAERLLAAHVDAYGPVYKVNLAAHWLILMGIALALLVVLAVVQKGKGIA